MMWEMKLGELEITEDRTPHSPHSERRINWSKRGPEWDLAQEVKYSNLFSFLPCSVSCVWSVFLFPRGNHRPGSSNIVWIWEDDTDPCYTAQLCSHHHTDVWIMLLGTGNWTWEIDLGMRHLTDNTEQKYIHQGFKGIHYLEIILTTLSLNSLSTIMNIIERFPIFSIFVYNHQTKQIFHSVHCQMNV